MPPRVANARSTTRRTASASVASSDAPQRSSPYCAFRSSRTCTLRRVAATRSPRASSFSVSVRPKPEEAPVMNQVFGSVSAFITPPTYRNSDPVLCISQSSVSRVWRDFGIQPHRVRGYMASDDPEFEEKAADIIGLNLKPPLNAAVFCVDEKSAIQALDRLDPVLPGRAERHGFEYFRHGTLSLYAALNTRTGDVLGKTTARHTSVEFVDFLGQIVASQPEGREIHIVADNLSAHKTKNVFEFLQAHPTVRIHYTPTYSSWLNQVEIWFSKIQRDVISRGIFTSTTDLSRKLIRYIKQYNKTATPFRWRVKNADNRIKPVTQRASDSLH